MSLTANKLPGGQSCGRCYFAGTHVLSADDGARTLVRCLRYPPTRLGSGMVTTLEAAHMATAWPVLTWDDWCGEWKRRATPPLRSGISVMSRPKKGDRVQTRFGKGTISDDYWRDRDRYTVNYDDGSESDHGAESITVLVQASKGSAS